MDFTKVDQLRDALKAMRPLNDAELKRLREEFIIENTYDSNAIEGSTLTLRETALILQEGITIAEKPVKEHLEAIGHRDAFEYILTLADAGTPLTERVIKDIHSLVLMNDAINKGAVIKKLVLTIMLLFLFLSRIGFYHAAFRPFLVRFHHFVLLLRIFIS